MKTLNLKEMEVIEGGRFLGWGWKTYGSPNEVTASWCKGNIGLEYTLVYTVFGLETSKSKSEVRCPLGEK